MPAEIATKITGECQKDVGLELLSVSNVLHSTWDFVSEQKCYVNGYYTSSNCNHGRHFRFPDCPRYFQL